MTNLANTGIEGAKVLGVILARGGSQGLPGKHLLELLGRPVIRYTFDHARAARLLSHVVVSSDDAEILAEASAAGLPFLLRPAELATSDASVQDVLLHAMDRVEESAGIRFDGVVTLYGNVPVRPDGGGGVIDRAVELLLRSGCHSVRSFAPVGKWHPQWMASLREGRAIALHAGSVHRRQDLTPLWLHDGGVVASSRAVMEEARRNRSDPHAFFGSDRRGFEVGQGETIEVDHQRDLYWAEAVLRDRAEKGRKTVSGGVRRAG
jgi:CMP-N,N'-diacetyllegionaminic acid synthase